MHHQGRDFGFMFVWSHRKPFRDTSAKSFNKTPLRSTFLQFSRAIQNSGLSKMKQSNSLVREGFQVSENPFTLPADGVNLDSTTKRAVTICHLFVNHWFTPSEIANLLEEDRRTVILALLHRHIIFDRRHTRGSAPLGIERRGSPGQCGKSLLLRSRTE
jgi:hypothetical protein